MTTDELIYKTAKADGMPDPLAVFIVGQARLESGNYQHRFFTLGKNAFGYSYDTNSKWQLAPGDRADNGVPIAQYRSVENSVHELTDWIKRRVKDGQFPADLKTITTPAKYSYHLRNGAHPYGGRSDKEYSDGIIARLALLPGKLLDILKGISPAAGIGGLVAILVLAFALIEAERKK